MYPLSDRFHTIAIQDSPKTFIRIYFIDDTVDCTDDNDVRTNGTLLVGAVGDTDSNGRIGESGVTFTEFFNPDKNLQIGTAVSSQIGMTLLNTDGALDGFQYGRCKVYLYVYDADYSTWRVCPMGVYIIEQPAKRKVQLVNAVGFDQMQKFDAIADTWWNGLNWSGGLTLLQIVNSMAAQLGVSVSSNTASAITNQLVTYTSAPFDCVSVTYREVLELIAEATGTVARFDRDGALDLRWLKTPTISGNNVTIDTDTIGNQCFSLDVAEYSVAPIDLVRGKFAEGDIGITVGSGTNEYTISNNLFFQGSTTAITTGRLNSIYTRLSAVNAYNPIHGTFIWDWSLEAGDIIYIVNDSTTYALPIFQQSMTWRGGYVVADVLSDGDAVRPVLDASTRDYYRLDSEMRTITIEADRINLLGYTTINNGFRVNLDGTFEANGATINGNFVSKGETPQNHYPTTQSIANGEMESSVTVGGVDYTLFHNSITESNGDCLPAMFLGTVSGGNHSTINPFSISVGGTDYELELSKNGAKYGIFSGGVFDSTAWQLSRDGAGFDVPVSVYKGLSVTGATSLNGDATVGGVLKVTNRIASDRLSTPGWYRVCWLEGGSQYSPIGALGALIRFNIVVYGNDGNNGNHQIDYISTYGTGNRKFTNEQSNGVDTKVDKIRCMRDGNDFYIDIHFTASSNTDVYVFWDFFTALSFLGKLTTQQLDPVADAPSGETSLAEYSFASSGVFFGDLFTNGVLLLPFLTVGKAIPSNADLHNYKTAGVYYATLAVASTLSNSSITTVPFKLIVMPGISSALWQIEIAAHSNCIIAIQHFNGSTWGGWKRLTPA